MAGTDQSLQRRNRRLAVALFAVVAGMVGLAYASVPLYSLFCRVTGFGGTTQRADAVPGIVSDRMVTVRFNADVNSGLPWDFRPVDKAITVRLGEQALTSFRAVNRSRLPTVGTATFNVTPDKAGSYFNKIQCFCFTEQILEPGKEVDLPVAFFVDPALVDDPTADDVTVITLSYTFFRAQDEQKILAQTAQASRPGAAQTN